MMYQKIPLYKARDFSDKFSATFGFFRQTWRVMLRTYLYFVLPVTVILAIGMDGYYDSVFSTAFGASSSPSLASSFPWASYVLLLVGGILASAMMLAVVYSVMTEYYTGTSNINSLAPRDMWPVLSRNILRSLALTALLLVFAVLMIAVSAFLVYHLTVFGFFIAMAIFAVLVPVFSLWPAVYLLERDNAVFPSLAIAFRYGFKTWGGLVVLLIVMGIIVYAISCLLIMPGAIMSGLKAVVFPGAFMEGGIGSVAYAFVQFVLILAALFAGNFAYSLLFEAVAFHYGHAAEVLDNVSVDDDINHFEELADNGTDEPADTDETTGIDNFDRL